MEVFFNTSPIIFIEKLGVLDRLVPEMWRKIYLTEAVINEINDKKISGRDYFQKYCVKDKIAVKAMPSALHKGERESIIGALETGVNFLIIDDIKARKKARSLGINTMGTIGVILTSVKKNIISVEDAILYLDNLREISFWINDELFDQIIKKLRSPE